MSRRLLLGTVAVLLPTVCYAMGSGYDDPIAPVILGVTTILFFAILGRFAARKLNQPSVLGELVMGMALGNVFYWFGVDLIILLREGSSIFDILGHSLAGENLQQAVESVLGNNPSAVTVYEVLRSDSGLSLLKIAHVIDIFSRYGVIFLLFLVGLDSSLEELRATGLDAVRVACIGVVAPIFLALLVTCYLLPELSLNEDLFIAAALSATSTSIAARVLRDMHKTRAGEAHVILGAGMVDDILGLIILAIVSGIIVHGSLEIREVIRIFALATLFISSALIIGPSALKWLVNLLKHMDVIEAKLFISFLFVMSFAWFATLLGLATIVGAFAAGIILHDGYFTHWGDSSKHQFTIKDLVAPLEAILAPIFFVLIGIQVKIESFVDTQVMLLALGLFVAAVVGKLLSGLGAGKQYNRLAIGIGMIPRGEVGLIFASIGKSLHVINDQLFAAIVLMVMGTTLLAPPLLKWRLR